jgi:hypothetical protein
MINHFYNLVTNGFKSELLLEDFTPVKDSQAMKEIRDIICPEGHELMFFYAIIPTLRAAGFEKELTAFDSRATYLNLELTALPTDWAKVINEVAAIPDGHPGWLSDKNETLGELIVLLNERRPKIYEALLDPEDTLKRFCGIVIALTLGTEYGVRL